ncbi:MAG: 16S rRNA (cytidine1402-2'-O)-methyltransferase [Chloroflexi bacterium]|nr:MAG: 16S rRNA (cytidine1402-2'-O)-methyltransferase [Chloroflexota bacterium]
MNTPLLSYYKDNEIARIDRILNELEKHDVALVSEAGTPVISDPGQALVKAVVQAGIGVISIPGPSSITTAIALSGFPADQFISLGFLPRRRSARLKLWTNLAQVGYTIVFFEAPHRIKASLQDMADSLGERNIVICRELSKRYEEVIRGTPLSTLEHLSLPKGEFTVVVEGAWKPNVDPDTTGIVRALAQLKNAGYSVRDASKEILAKYHSTRRIIYELWLDL